MNKYFKTTAIRTVKLMVVASAILVMPTSCKKWLEEKPTSYYAADTFFKDANEAKMAVLGIYESMSNNNTYGFYMSLVFDIDSDIAQMDGTGLSNDPRVAAHYAMTPVHIYVAACWQLLYKGIDRANLVIERIPEMDLYKNGTDAQKKDLARLLAEAKFLRGQYYFDLIRLFGDVPMKLKPTAATDNLQLPRTDRELVYDQVFKDMNEAIPDLPWASQKPVDERISKGAAKGMLARAALYRAGYSLRANELMERPAKYKDYYAITLKETKEVMESGEHILNSSYEQIFRNHCKLILEPKESMYEVALYNLDGGLANSGVIGTWNAPVAADKNPYGRANSFYKTTALFQKSYATGDLRRDVAVGTYQLDVNAAKIEFTGTNDSKWAPGKWRRDWQNTGPKDLNNTDINWTLLRYSDILLMRAEAENEINEGPNSDAYLAVNMVRRRGFGKPLTTVNAAVDLPAGLNKDTFLAKLQTERAYELCFEGTRKSDLIRWNILGPSLRAAQAALKVYRAAYPYVAGTNFVDNKHELYPIPQGERDLNPKLSQNPKY
ncbi:hypothetical protein HDC92_001416 [Pedobacter sp. AK017]|uniref:RagB/SusD family nutrient uptake outer membrane protein n=1 Tax=Pedobacter sp. AK017 TaxID=2723073 RepID=UPI00161A98D3|nr:RagB/SusD family nutrient uptake outer membrane protein [Pedobacter sp. AK017]MBB5437742.1 hypothetical protein [Pedobacter sp. AK017]